MSSGISDIHRRNIRALATELTSTAKNIWSPEDAIRELELVKEHMDRAIQRLKENMKTSSPSDLSLPRNTEKSDLVLAASTARGYDASMQGMAPSRTLVTGDTLKASATNQDVP
jgi:hypothetical protein